MKKIILVGMPGCGKSTVAKKLSELIGIKNYESDEIFENKFKIKITDFFKKFGEEDFRLKETEILKEILKEDEFILSTGGGVILKEENRKLIFTPDNETFYLKATCDTIFQRLKTDNTRPLLLVENPKKEIEKMLEKREPYYALAKHVITVDTKTPDEITKETAKNL